MHRTFLSVVIVAVVFGLYPTIAAYAQSPADKIAEHLIDEGHATIAILPDLIYSQDGKETTVGDLGPRGRIISQQLEKQLRDASQGRYKVVSQDEVRKVLISRGITIESLRDRRTVGKLRDDLGVDVIISSHRQPPARVAVAPPASALTPDAQPPTPSTNETNKPPLAEPTNQTLVSRERPLEDAIKHNVVSVADGVVESSVIAHEDRTLAKAAYQGESWELRRWQDGKLLNLAVDLPLEKSFGKGPQWERIQYAKLQPVVAHPAAVREFPYAVDVFAGGSRREPVRVLDSNNRDAYVVELNPGETYSIGLRNDTDRPVFVALYIDGLSSIDQQQAEPEDLEVSRMWYIPANSGQRMIEGWYGIKLDEKGAPLSQQQLNKFAITERHNALAFGRTIEDRIGMITAIVYTTDMKDIPNAGAAPMFGNRSLPQSDYGTGLGELKQQQLDYHEAGQRGIILGALTYYYRDREALQKLQNGAQNDAVLRAIVGDGE